MRPWMWFVLGALAGAVATYIYQERATIAKLYANRDKIGAAGDVASGLSDAWAGIEKLLGK